MASPRKVCPYCGASNDPDREDCVSCHLPLTAPRSVRDGPSSGDEWPELEPDDPADGRTRVETSVAPDGTVTTTRTTTTTKTDYFDRGDSTPWYVGRRRRASPLGMVAGGVIFLLFGLAIGATTGQSCSYDAEGQQQCVPVSNWGLGAFIAFVGLLLLLGGLYWHASAQSWDPEGDEDSDLGSSDTTVITKETLVKPGAAPWNCTYCQAQNPAGSLRCQSCGAPKSTTGAPSA